MEGTTALLARLLYGTGMRLMEGVRLRVKDADFDRGVIVVREAKGNKDRVVMLPRTLRETLQAQVVQARAVWLHDRQMGVAGVEVPATALPPTCCNRAPTSARCKNSWAIPTCPPP